jgi:hypothetical protein
LHDPLLGAPVRWSCPASGRIDVPMRAPWKEAKALQRLLLDAALEVVTRSEAKEDQPEISRASSLAS